MKLHDLHTNLGVVMHTMTPALRGGPQRTLGSYRTVTLAKMMNFRFSVSKEKMEGDRSGHSMPALGSCTDVGTAQTHTCNFHEHIYVTCTLVNESYLKIRFIDSLIFNESRFHFSQASL